MAEDTRTNEQAIAEELFRWNSPWNPYFVIHGRPGEISEEDPYLPIVRAVLAAAGRLRDTTPIDADGHDHVADGNTYLDCQGCAAAAFRALAASEAARANLEAERDEARNLARERYIALGAERDARASLMLTISDARRMIPEASPGEVLAVLSRAGDPVVLREHEAAMRDATVRELIDIDAATRFDPNDETLADWLGGYVTYRRDVDAADPFGKRQES